METFAAAFVALALIAAGLGIGWSAVTALIADRHPETFGVVTVVAVISIIVKELLYQWTKRVARRTKNASVLANAWHHRSDALSSVPVLAGGLLGGAGWPIADPLAGMIVAAMVAGVGLRIAYDAMLQLSEAAIEPELLEVIKRLIVAHPEVRQHHYLRTRRVGREIFVDVHILVHPTLSVIESHNITRELERDIRAAVEDPVNVLVHVEPDIPEERR
ncbi:MAG: cation diffusion facilitator family transporter [Deltaproteobacteria bacterium]|nr:cation diffusion facilitator family transporter [Deltaproteobacteria bacterium]